MITKRIPDKFNIDDIKISELIYESVGRRFPIYWNASSRIIKIDEPLTNAELIKIKADFLSAVEEVSDL